MAIKLTYYTLVIPISTVLSKFNGTWSKWYELNENECPGRGWDDGNLFAKAVMDPTAVDMVIKKWEKLGFYGKSVVNGKQQWFDYCLTESDTDCPWLSYSEDSLSVFISGRDPGEVVFPELKRTYEPVQYGATVDFLILVSILASIVIFILS